MGKIGLHIEHIPDTDRLNQCLDAWKPGDVVLVGEAEGHREALRDRYPHLRIWVRRYDDNDHSTRISASDYIKNKVKEFSGTSFYLAIDNEPPITTDRITWMRDVVRGCTSEGVRCAIPGFPVGGPQKPNFDVESLHTLPMARPLIDAIKAGNHVFRLNEYAGIFWCSGWLWDRSKTNYDFEVPDPRLEGLRKGEANISSQYHCGRWKFWTEMYGDDLQILIGENGFDTIDGDPAMHDYAQWVDERIKYPSGVHGWSPAACFPFWRDAFHEEYNSGKSDEWIWAKQLILMAENMYAEPNVLGQCQFCFSEGTDHWGGWDVSHKEELWDLIGEYNDALDTRSKEHSIGEKAETIHVNVGVKMKKSPRVQRRPRPVYSFMFWDANKWIQDPGQYSSSYYGVGRAVMDLFGPGNELWIKVADGSKYMGEFDNAVPEFAIATPSDASAAVSAIKGTGCNVRFWANPKGLSDWEMEVHKLISICIEPADPPNGLVLDVEPYRHFWGVKHPKGFAKQFVSRLQNGLHPWQRLWLSTDARGDKLQEINWDEWEPHISLLTAQCYWNAFQLPYNQSLQICEAAMGKVNTQNTKLAYTLPWFEDEGHIPTTQAMISALQWCEQRDYPVAFYVIEGYSQLAQLAEIVERAEDG